MGKLQYLLRLYMRRSFQNSIDFGKATASPTAVPGPKLDSVENALTALFYN
jgi:hypothetical protein